MTTIRIVPAEENEMPLLRWDVDPLQEQLRFYAGGTEIVRFEACGDIYVRGKLTASDLEVAEAMRDFLRAAGQLK